MRGYPISTLFKNQIVVFVYWSYEVFNGLYLIDHVYISMSSTVIVW